MRCPTTSQLIQLHGVIVDQMASSGPRILVVEDDVTMREMLVRYLGSQDLDAVAAMSGAEMDAQFTMAEPDLVVLDLRLDRENGLDLLRRLRSRSKVPVIIMTGYQREEIDRVVGLELGADDYLTKPFGVRELVARIRAVLRRRKAGRAAAVRELTISRYQFGGWLLEPRRRRLSNPAGEEVPLTNGEYGLLLAFLKAPGSPLSREHLLQSTHMHKDVFDRSIDVQVLRLRRKLESDSSAPKVIQTQRGVGYMFALAVETK
jgi:two-component system OmpR family response regulator